MFRLLSKESNIFSIPVYIAFLFCMVMLFNLLNFSLFKIVSVVITFFAFALGYFCFNRIGLNYKTHLPLFLYTFFIFAFYSGDLDLGLIVGLFVNLLIILLLTDEDEEFKKKSHLIIGSLLAILYIFLPTAWPTIIFVILHIIATSNHIALHIFKLFFGALLVVINYFIVMYFLGYHQWDAAYLPLVSFQLNSDYKQLLVLIPIGIMLVVAVFDHFVHYNKKSPSSRFKYTFLMIYSIAQLLTIVFYMGKNFEYLLLLALPVSILLSRLLKFSDAYWKKEFGLWVIISTLIIFKLVVHFY